jgi:hypothetical protein
MKILDRDILDFEWTREKECWTNINEKLGAYRETGSYGTKYVKYNGTYRPEVMQWSVKLMVPRNCSDLKAVKDEMEEIAELIKPDENGDKPFHVLDNGLSQYHCLIVYYNIHQKTWGYYDAYRYNKERKDMELGELVYLLSTRYSYGEEKARSDTVKIQGRLSKQTNEDGTQYFEMYSNSRDLLYDTLCGYDGEKVEITIKRIQEK